VYHQARLIEEQLPRLRRYARALTGNRALSDDLVQDTLERAWTRLHLWRPGSDMRAWLFTIMHNVFVNGVRARRLETIPLEDEPSASEAAGRGTPEDGLLMRDLQVALAQLPAEQREVLLLVALEGLRYEEIAEVLGVPVGTVMSRLSRARERLRTLLAGTGPVLWRVK
jgi:RNA polymerase sigma-70 factor (ECF subfamily)